MANKIKVIFSKFPAQIFVNKPIRVKSVKKVIK